MNLATQLLLGVSAYAVLIPGFAWVAGWMYTFAQPLDKAIHVDRVREFYIAGAAFGAVVGTCVVGVIMKNYPL